MSTILRADNKNLFRDAKTTFLLDNASSHASTLTVANTEGFFANSFVCLGQIGSENTEIVQIENVDSQTGIVTLIYFNGTIVNMVAAGATMTVITTDKPHGMAVGSTVTIANSISYNGAYVLQASPLHTANTFVILKAFSTVQAGLWISATRTTTNFAHAESTRVTVVAYNAVRFFYTQLPTTPIATPVTTYNTKQNVSTTDKVTETYTAPNTATYTKATDPSYVHTVDITPPIVFSGTTPLTNFLYLQVDDFFTQYADNKNYTGYGWFAFFNTTTLQYSPISNPIPYGGFDANTVKSIFDTFDSCLNTKEIKTISQSDRYSWLNEAYSLLINELNLGNWEYTSTRDLILTIIPGVGEYLLPEDFSDLLYVKDSYGHKIYSYAATFEQENSVMAATAYTQSGMNYLITGRYIVFNPVPDSATFTTVTIGYLRNAPVLSKLSDVVDLPNRAYYYIKDFMLYRAYKKLANPTEANWYYTTFQKNVENMKIYAIKRDEGLDSWSIAANANV